MTGSIPRPISARLKREIEAANLTDLKEAADVKCPFCGRVHNGPLPCRHCGEPDIPEFEE